ncbi:MAG: methyltransferase [Phototrophicales bacterium]|nr:MAG: methyltransferase [Phototrophicales bacterium]
MDENIRTQIDQYISALYAPEDDALQQIRHAPQQHDMPAIAIAAHEGRLLQMLALSVNAKKIVEIGTLAGYSGTWLARMLPPDGVLYTVEKSSKHAEVARQSFEQAGLSDRVEVLQGDAHDILQKLAASGPYDFVFIDADKTAYTMYLNWAADNLRPGGMVAAHNALRGGRVLAPQSDDDRAMAAFNRVLAEHPQLESTIIAVGDGMAIGIKKR